MHSLIMIMGLTSLAGPVDPGRAGVLEAQAPPPGGEGDTPGQDIKQEHQVGQAGCGLPHLWIMQACVLLCLLLSLRRCQQSAQLNPGLFDLSRCWSCMDVDPKVPRAPGGQVMLPATCSHRTLGEVRLEESRHPLTGAQQVTLWLTGDGFLYRWASQ
jgi:hypothetical protein